MDDELNVQTKPEHVLNDALGGRKTTRKVICSGCNNIFGGGIDKVLTEQFEIIRNLFQMKSGSGRTAPMLRKVKAGSKAINLHGHGNLELVVKPFEIVKHADGRFDLRITARSLEAIDRLVPHIAAALALPEDIVRQQLAKGQAMMLEQRPEVVPFRMMFGGSDALRLAAKSCLVLWALKVGNDEVRRVPYASVRNFILNTDDSFVYMRTKLDTRALAGC
jgi:HNH endonuclease